MIVDMAAGQTYIAFLSYTRVKYKSLARRNNKCDAGIIYDGGHVTAI